MPMWTQEQLAAIEARNHTILVSAAAGSGKTAVLVERIITLLREGVPMDRMMIVTFTRAAAAEMRQRLNLRIRQEAFRQPQWMGRALDDLESAEISTIHSFCQHLLREEFQAAGIDPLSTICEEQKRAALFHEAYVQAMNELLTEAHPEFARLVDSLDTTALEEWNKRLYEFLTSLPHPFAWLKEHAAHLAEEPFDQQPWYQVIRRYANQQTAGMELLLEQERAMLDDAAALKERWKDWQQDQETYRRFQASVMQTPEKLPELLATYTFQKLSTVKGLAAMGEDAQQWDKAYKKLRAAHKELVKELQALLQVDTERWRRELPVIQAEVEALALLTERTAQHFSEIKREQHLLDFSDLEQLTLLLLDDPPLREKLQDRFDHIFVDECQDVSAVQDAIIQQLQGEKTCLFMVGDVKQSIYRFRQADPTLFLQRMRTFSDEEDACQRRIFLQRNFRSCPAILEATNRVFRRLMKASVTELDYMPEDELIPGRRAEQDPPVEIELIRASGKKAHASELLTAQAMRTAARIEAMTRETFFDGEKKRAYTYRDMVILMPSVSQAGAQVADILQSRGIPVYFDGVDSYFTLPEILTVTSLLSLIDNRMQDIPLLAVLKMSPFLLTDQDLAAIRLCKTGHDVPFYEAFDDCCEQKTPLGEKCERIRKQLEEWRFLSRTLPLSDFLWQLLRETGLFAVSGALPEGALRQANLMLLCQRAAEYEDAGGVSLSGFLQGIEELRAAGDSRSAKVLGEHENLVRIMTIHKSKGLEFPVVFVMGLGGALHLPAGKKLRTHQRLGVCLPYMNPEMNIRRETVMDRAFDLQRRLDEKAERARLLYVAMTRARERLILLVNEGEDLSLWRMPESPYRIWQAGSMADWLMQAVCDEVPEKEFSTGYQQATTPWKINDSVIHNPQDVEKTQLFHMDQAWIDALVCVPPGERINDRWREAEQPISSMPLKTSVSAMVRQKALQDPFPLDDKEECPEDKAKTEIIMSPLRLSELPRQPKFLQEKQPTGAEAGTLVHHVLALVNLDSLRKAESLTKALAKELDGMQRQGLLSSEEAKTLRVNMLLRFYQSALGQRMLRSTEVQREWHFNLRLREQEDSLLQGVIDCAFRENGAWILLDYKTDHIHDEEAFQARYALQLQLYAQAIEHITDTPVREKWLYALTLDKAFQI